MAVRKGSGGKVSRLGRFLVPTLIFVVVCVFRMGFICSFVSVTLSDLLWLNVCLCFSIFHFPFYMNCGDLYF